MKNKRTDNATESSNSPSAQNGQGKNSEASTKKALSRKEKMELVRKANQMMEKVWDRISNSSDPSELSEANRATDA